MAANTLVIVESPGKVKTVQKYLDMISPDTYKVEASVGHICDLPKKDLGFNTTTFEPKYEIYEDKIQVVKKLKDLSKRLDNVILATDDDREGEAIAQHLARELGLNNPDRIAFAEITKTSLAEALKRPRKIDRKKVDSQETRRLLDRMIGWRVSPVARSYVVPDSSMGRVQTAVLSLLVDLERRIRDFRSTHHFGVEAFMVNNEGLTPIPWTATWDTSTWLKPDEQYWMDRNSAEAISKINDLKVVSVTEGVSESSPPAPFITSTLQRAAQKLLKLTPRQTMDLAQKLYEAGAITYMRTDNPNISEDAFVALKSYAVDNDLPIVDSIRKFKSKSGAQEAHEAIRPTSFMLKEVGGGKIQDLYNLIWTRSVACQLKSAKYDTREVILEKEVPVLLDGMQQRKVATFKARGRTLTYSGWMTLTDRDFSEVEEDEKDNEPNNPIPLGICEGDIIKVSSAQLKEKKTSPPNRLTVTALIEKLESSGIGRPSTFVSIIETIESRNYITYEKSKIHVTDRGFKIIDVMEGRFKFIDVKYTSEMEKKLDEIANGQEWFPITLNFWNEINQEVEEFIKYIHSTLPQHKCEVCSSLVIKTQTAKGAFWKCVGCSARYADGSGQPGPMQVVKETEFLCLECDAKLIYRKGAYEGKSYEYFSCSNSTSTSNKCFAKYELVEGANPVMPNFELYKERSKHKCTLCDRRLILCKTKEQPGKPSKSFWRCSGNTKDKPLCNAFYEDKAGSPDYDAFDRDHKYMCSLCQSYLRRKKYADKDGYFWVCSSEKTPKTKKCKSFYDDVDAAPDYDKFQRDHEHKCLNCNSYIALKVSKLGDEIWRCQSPLNSCGWEYDDLNGKPNLEAAKLKYIHKCEACKLGYYVQRDGSKGAYWACASWDCKSTKPDLDGKPDMEYKRPEKK